LVGYIAINTQRSYGNLDVKMNHMMMGGTIRKPTFLGDDFLMQDE